MHDWAALEKVGECLQSQSLRTFLSGFCTFKFAPTNPKI